MPELPEVETYARYFAKHALAQPVARVEVRDARILGETRRETFVRTLRGRAFTEVRRHGKHLFAEARGRGDSAWLHLHFGMTGDLTYLPPADGGHREIVEPRFTRILFRFANGAALAFEDMRLFGLADLIAAPEALIAARGLGPDPLDRAFTFAKFDALLARRRGAIKSLLMSQEIVAGLGNLYVDEMLHQTAIHPRRAADRLKDDERRALFAAMRAILRQAIARQARGAELPPSFLIHHREVGEDCPKCGGTIRRTVVFGRTTYFCPKHQR
ncbi:MAG TPA: DNA-formamidopyrimidine glycosylase family protein [Thermoanaerobaculia bacterium]|nr:DNA-formamidopyrimidine glycosylase family protein [Thermoanaerobaculia bacterium]